VVEQIQRAIFKHEKTYSNRAGARERELPDHLSDFERELQEQVKMLGALRFTRLEKGSDVEPNERFA
jgi:hypothetical protein